jgi:two-component system response regulator AtoC
MKQINPLTRAIMITAYGSVGTAVEVMKLGADDFLEKPIQLKPLLEKIQVLEQRIAIYEEADHVAQVLENEKLPIQMAGSGEAMKEVLSLARRVAPTPWTVLIRGETGTGKELMARLIHLLSPVKDGPFVGVNCGAIPENLFESDLFGHEKGAFTGASSARKGKFELAQDGTLFLDEIGEMPLSLQSKLLRVLQEKKLTRVGGEREIGVSARVLAATNRDLRSLVEDEKFREDLYYRINVFEIALPSLRQRKEDLPELVDFFIRRYSPHPVSFDADAMTTLAKYGFPGNIRELEHIVQRTVTLARGNVIRERDLPQEIRFHSATEPGDLSRRMEAVEREMLITALESHGWVQTRAAGSLGISERVLRYKMKKYGIKSDE